MHSVLSPVTAAPEGIRAVKTVEPLRRGLVARPPQRVSKDRRYPRDTVRRVRFMKRAQACGFSLQEIKELLSLRTASEAGCAAVREHGRTDSCAHGDEKSAFNACRCVLRARSTARSEQWPSFPRIVAIPP